MSQQDNYTFTLDGITHSMKAGPKLDAAIETTARLTGIKPSRIRELLSDEPVDMDAHL